MLGRDSAVATKGLAEIGVEQVDIGIEREAGRVMAEPALHLHGVAPFCKEPTCDGMPKRVEARPLDACLADSRS